MQRRVFHALLAVLVVFPGCTCGGLSGSEGPVDYTRCTNAEPPEVEASVGELKLRSEDRTLHLEGPGALRVAAFTGPVGASLDAADLAPLRASQPQLVLWLGGLGEDAKQGAANLNTVAALGAPVLFLAGGADRLPVVEEAFEALEADIAARVLHVSGVRAIRAGDDVLGLMPGSALGRYAIDEDACGFGPSDVSELAEALEEEKGRTWLLSWDTPSGWDLSSGFGGVEAGSPDLHALVSQRGLYGGLSAYPEGQAGAVRVDEKTPGLRAVVPRLGPSGSNRADRSRGESAVLALNWGADGLVLPDAQ